MIKGLSDSLVGAMPILDSALMRITDRIAESLSNIALPDVENSLFVNQNATSVIGNIGSRTNLWCTLSSHPQTPYSTAFFSPLGL